MSNYKYILDKSSKKYVCPQCNKKRFVRYIDTETNEYLPNEFGTCDRLINCGYDNNPYKAGYHKNELAKNGNNWQSKKVNENDRKRPKYEVAKCYKILQHSEPIPEKVLLHTLKDYDKNNFIQYLCNRYGTDAITKQIEAYYVGTVSNYTSFAYIDKNGVCRAISLIEYNKQGKRNKDGIKQARNIHTFLQAEYKRRNQTPPDWLNRYLQNESKFTCLYGEHLISQPDNLYKPIAVVEAPKTAFIASLVYDAFTWVAVGALTYLTQDRTKAIQGREVYLFPDTSTDGKAFDLWNDKAKQYGFTCIDILENIGTIDEKMNGYDLADYLLEYEFSNMNMGANGNKWEHSIIKDSNTNETVKVEQSGVMRSEFKNEAEILNVYKCRDFELFENENLTANTGKKCESNMNECELNRTKPNHNNIAFVDIDGILYIPTPPNFKTFTRYSKGVTAYNHRSQTPDFIETIPTGTRQVFINLKTLTI
jgi:hypothetical protein